MPPERRPNRRGCRARRTSELTRPPSRAVGRPRGLPSEGNKFGPSPGGGREVILLSAVTGALTGFGVALFDRAVVEGLYDRFVDLSPWVLAFLPLAGLALAAASLRWLARRVSSASADALPAVLPRCGPSDPPPRGARNRVAAPTTLGFGGAMGLEGPSLYLGASIGTFLQQRFRRWFGAPDRRVLLVAGAAAGVAAIFKAPANGRGVRARSPLPGRSGAAHAAPGAGRVRHELPELRRDQRHGTDPCRSRQSRRSRSPTSGAPCSSVCSPASALAASCS